MITYAITFALHLAIASIVSSSKAHQPSLNEILGMLQMCAIPTDSHLQVSSL
jgi:hypothetical protein